MSLVKPTITMYQVFDEAGDWIGFLPRSSSKPLQVGEEMFDEFSPRIWQVVSVKSVKVLVSPC